MDEYDATAPGRKRLGPQCAAASRWKDRTLGGGSKTVVPIHFWCRAINAGGQATREIDTGLRSYVLTSLVRTGDAPFWTYVVAPVTMPRKGGRTPTIVF